MAVASAPTDVSNAELIRWAFDAINRHDLAALREVYTDDTYERLPDRVCHGGDEIIDYFRETFAGVSDLQVEIVALAEDGDTVFVRWHMTGTHTGPLLGIESTGKPLAIDGADHFTIRDGKVVSNFVIVDQVQYARQIGMMPADESLGDRAMKAAFNARTKLVEKLQRR